MSNLLRPLLLSNTCLSRSSCTHLNLAMPCTCLQHNLRMCHHGAQLSPRYRCSSSELRSPQASRSLTDRRYMSSLLRPLLPWNTCPPRSPCKRPILQPPCTCLPHTVCMCLQRVQKTPRRRHLPRKCSIWLRRRRKRHLGGANSRRKPTTTASHRYP